ncbi:MAG: hypothetical protein QOG53_1499 [Frankiales bacterium]|jgi:serine/threonine protein kinase|nr:hypothetical protein [Frankiales bacterium]
MSVSIDLGISGLADAEEVGRGGFGVVYRARQIAVGRSVAVKLLSAVSLSDETRRRFERECKAMAAVSSHPHIVALYESGTSASGRPYIVMEYVPAGALGDRIPLPWPQAVDVGVKMAGALETSHRIGIFHRDVKPENILLSAYGEPKLTDFGVAKVAESSETPSGNITASILHAAPEMLSGARPSASTDVYSLASTIYALIAGRAPFAAEHEEETLAPVLMRISTAPVPNFGDVDVPAEVFDVLAQAMSKNPRERPSTPADLGRLLSEAQTANGLPPTEMLIEGVERTPSGVFKAIKDDRVTQSRSRESVHVPTQSAGGGSVRDRGADQTENTERSRASRQSKVLIGAVVMLLIGGGVTGVVLTRGGGSVDHSTSYVFSDASNAVVRASRAWQLDKRGTTINAATIIRNLTAKATHLTDLEVIPKQLATNVGQVHLTPGFVVLEADPVVRYDVTIPANGVVTIAWSVRSQKVANDAVLSDAAKAQRKDQQALSGRLATLALSSGFDAASVVPFATNPDPGIRKPGAIPSPGASGLPGASTGDGTHAPLGNVVTVPSATTKPSTAARTNHAPKLKAIVSRTSGERVSVTVPLSAADSDGDRLSYSVSGLPQGLSWSATKIFGTIAYDAVSLTTTRTAIKSRPFTVTVTVTDGHATDSGSFTWTVRDTHTRMPNYVGKYGCGACSSDGLPDVDALFVHDFKCSPGTDTQYEHGTIWRQSIAPGTTIIWGQPATIWYYEWPAGSGHPSNEECLSSDSAVQRGW